MSNAISPAGAAYRGPVQNSAPASGAAGPFDPATAIRLGQFVAEAYAMYGASPDNLTPPATASFPAGYELVGWVTMEDFFLDTKTRVFYGLVAQDMQQPERFVLAIRGTSSWVEWWDDLLSIELVPFKGGLLGRAGKGFVDIYGTLEVVENGGGGVPLTAAGGFSSQIAELTRRRKNLAAGGAAGGASSIEVSGHSLGSALATLYVQDNAQAERLPVPRVYTFASPRVGDTRFATLFDALPSVSWRVANDLDVVTWVPTGAFQHVATLKSFVPWDIVPSVSCMHALTTYFSLIDPALKPDSGCRVFGEGVTGPSAVSRDGSLSVHSETAAS